MDPSQTVTAERIAGLRKMEEILSYQFRDITLLAAALTHRSFVNENPHSTSGDNERLEFLGDAVLQLVITDLVMRLYPCHAEGQLTKIRSSLVSEQSLAAIGRNLGLGEYLLVGKGEELSGGRDKNSVLANALEAVFGAIYLDGGLQKAEETIRKIFAPSLEGDLAGGDHKSALQEICHSLFQAPPVYNLKDVSGPDHSRTYEVSITIAGRTFPVGRGRSKKEAEQQAARMALERLCADLENEA